MGPTPLYRAASGQLLCPRCREEDSRPVYWVCGEGHENCLGCGSRLWPSKATGSLYGVLDRGMAPLWVRFSERVGNPVLLRTVADAARTERPLGAESVLSVYQWLESRLVLEDPGTREARWLRALHYEVRRSHTPLDPPVLCTVPRRLGDEEPVVVTSAPPQAREVRCRVHAFLQVDLGLSP